MGSIWSWFTQRPSRYAALAAEVGGVVDAGGAVVRAHVGGHVLKLDDSDPNRPDFVCCSFLCPGLGPWGLMPGRGAGVFIERRVAARALTPSARAIYGAPGVQAALATMPRCSLDFDASEHGCTVSVRGSVWSAPQLAAAFAATARLVDALQAASGHPLALPQERVADELRRMAMAAFGDAGAVVERVGDSIEARFIDPGADGAEASARLVIAVPVPLSASAVAFRAALPPGPLTFLCSPQRGAPRVEFDPGVDAAAASAVVAGVAPLLRDLTALGLVVRVAREEVRATGTLGTPTGLVPLAATLSLWRALRDVRAGISPESALAPRG